VDAFKEWLREKQERGVRDVRVNTVLGKFEELEAEGKKRSNSMPRRGRRKKLDLVGTAEAAEILGVERPRIGRWKKAKVLPEPVAELAAGPVWFREQIESVQEERDRRRRVKSPERKATATK
jgi:hypothetical protein